MNTYRITVTITHSPEVETRFTEFDVDARQPLTAIAHVLHGALVAQFKNDQVTITSRLYATDIFPPNRQKIRQVGA